MKTYSPGPTAAALDSPSAAKSAPLHQASQKVSVARRPAHSWRQWVTFDHSRILLPQFVFSRGKGKLAQLYRLSLDEGEPRAKAGAFDRFCARLIYAMVALRQVWLFFRRYSSFVKQKYGVSRTQQLKDLWYCAWQQNQFPRHYYWRELYLIPNRKDWLAWIEHRQVNTLLNHLNRHLPLTEAINKVRFFEHCVTHKLPTVPVLASWNDHGRMAARTPVAVAADIFLKPTDEYGSVGIMPIVFNPTTGTHRFENADLTWPQLLAAIGAKARADGRGLLIQRRLSNAARNAIYGNSDICNVRIITGLEPGGDPEAISALVRLPSSMTTTGHDRNIMIATIDIASGRMQTGRFRETTLGTFPVHPDTGAPIENRILPGWNEMLELARHGHRTYSWLPFIGWDLVDSTDGILLLEANAYWGGDSAQLPGATPLGRTRFPDIYLKCFEQLYGPTAAANRAIP